VTITAIHFSSGYTVIGWPLTKSRKILKRNLEVKKILTLPKLDSQTKEILRKDFVQQTVLLVVSSSE